MADWLGLPSCPILLHCVFLCVYAASLALGLLFTVCVGRIMWHAFVRAASLALGLFLIATTWVKGMKRSL